MSGQVDYKKAGYFTKDGLLERGWTDEAIKDSL